MQILNIARYYDASQAGWAVNTPVQNGNFGPADRSRGLHGQLLGIPVFVSSRVVNTLNSVRNLLSHKEMQVFAHQTPGGGKVRVQAQNLLDFLGILTVWDTIYGVKVTREATASKLSASNAFIAS